MNAVHSPFFPLAACVRAFSAICLLWLAFGNISAAQTWTQAWSDEFNGPPNSAISAANWTYDTGSLMVNNEVEYYCAPGSSTPPCVPGTPNAYIDGSGHLVIQAIQINSSVTPYSGSWTSARLKTLNLQNFQYGRLESSMTLPVGPGIWPAYWALGNNINSVNWPTSGEIDFMENVPPLGPGAIQSTIHGGNSASSCYCGENGLGKPYSFSGGANVTSFHTYGGIWSPNMIQFYVDDPTNIFFVVTASDIPSTQQWDFNHPFFLLLNLAVGGTGSWPGPPDSSTPNPAVMTVDYVRWYKPSPLAGPTITASPITLAGGTGSSTVNLSSTSGTGRVYLSCTTTAPNASCSIKSADALNPYTVDFSHSGSGTATVTVTSTAAAAGGPKAQDSGIPSPALSTSGIPASGILVSRHSNWLVMSNLLLFSGFVLASFVFLPGRNRGLRRGLGGSGLMLALLVMHPGCGSGNNSSGGGGGGSGYTVTVEAFTVSSSGNPDSTLTIPVKLN
jgi:beta-glucanase (GH16 family)